MSTVVGDNGFHPAASSHPSPAEGCGSNTPANTGAGTAGGAGTGTGTAVKWQRPWRGDWGRARLTLKARHQLGYGKAAAHAFSQEEDYESKHRNAVA